MKKRLNEEDTFELTTFMAVVYAGWDISEWRPSSLGADASDRLYNRSGNKGGKGGKLFAALTRCMPRCNVLVSGPVSAPVTVGLKTRSNEQGRSLTPASF